MMARAGAVLLCVHLLLCGGVSFIHAACDSNNCDGQCRENNNCGIHGESSLKWPPGSDLCSGSKCKCCAPSGEVKCKNMGGTCRDTECTGAFKPLFGADANSCEGSKFCCVQKNQEKCIDALGTCKDSCPTKFRAFTFPGSTDSLCPGTKVCCVHDDVEPCENTLCSGKCRSDKKCKPTEATGKFPPGGDLCKGGKCECCVLEEEAECKNMGGTCRDNPCAGAFKPLVGADANSCPASKFCCVRKNQEKCIDALGACLNAPCPENFRPFVFPGSTDSLCPGTRVCCVHNDVEPCENNFCDAGKCRDEDCKSAEVEGKFPPGGNLCKGGKCQCCYVEEEAKCLNEGGQCRNGDTCSGNFIATPDAPADACPEGKSCCIHNKNAECLKIDGKCSTTCPMSFKSVQVTGVATMCQAGKVCCVHEDRENCAGIGGRCFNGDCDDDYKSAKGAGKCSGKRMKCCIK